MEFAFGLLGPLEVAEEGRAVPITAAKQRILLASLVLEANRAVPAGWLIDRMWHTASPQDARATLHSYVMRLRRTLRDAAGTDPIATRPDGYLLECPEQAVDLHRFRSMVRQATSRPAAETADTARLLGQALALWRGEPLADVPSEVLHRDIVPALREERLAAMELRIELDLRLGRHAELIAELGELTSRHPLRERLWAHRMLALYRCERQAEALDCYRRVAMLLADELGVDPGTELRALHEAMLHNDPKLASAGGRTTATGSGTGLAWTVRRNDLPGDIPDFTGRQPELRALLAAVPEQPDETATVLIYAVDGMAGIGKTTLAVHAAHQLAERFPDGQLFIDLHGHTEGREPMPASAALDVLLRAVGVPTEEIPDSLDDRAALWRATVADRRVLVVLDNAAATAQVRPLLPGARGCLALVTSRRRLTGLDTAGTVSLDVLAASDAMALFTQVVGADRAAADPVGVLAVAQLTGYLPLAIRIAAARLRTRPAWTVRHLADRLRERRRLTELAVDERSVAAAFALSSRHLTAEQQRMFRLLGLVPGSSFDRYAAAALCATSVDRAEQLLEDLLDVHLLQQPAAGRYRFHDLLRDQARNLPGDPQAGRDALDRLLDYYLQAARRASTVIDPNGHHLSIDAERRPAELPAVADHTAAMSFLDIESDNLVAAIDVASDWSEKGSLRRAWRLAYSLWRYFQLRGDIQERLRMLQLALAAARVVDPHGEAHVHRVLGVVYWDMGRYDDARDHQNQALAGYRQADDRWGEGSALSHLGNIFMQMGQYDRAVDHYQRSLPHRRHTGDLQGESMTLANLGVARRRLGQYGLAIRHQFAALALARRIGDRQGEAYTLDNLGELYEQLGRWDDAIHCQQQCLALVRELGDRYGEAWALNNLGRLNRRQGRPDLALRFHRDALVRIRELGNRRTKLEVLNDLGSAYHAAGQPERARACHTEAEQLAAQIMDRHQQAQAYEGIAQTLLEDDPHEAANRLRAALAIYDDIGAADVGRVRTQLDEHCRCYASLCPTS